MTQPLISIYIPTKDRPQLLRRAVSSCLGQDYTNIEILIVDDGSAADAAQAIKQLAAIDNRIRLFRQSPSQGAPAARNLAIMQAAGDYITGLDDDDEFLPGRLSAFVQYAATAPANTFLSTGYVYALASGQQLRGLTGRCRYGLADLLFKNLVGNQIFCKTAALRLVGGFDPDLPACQDYDLWIRLCAAGYHGVRLPLVNYLVHQEHEQPRISTRQRRLHGQLQLATKHRHLMTNTQYRAQLFYAHLYAGPVSIRQIVQHCPLRLWPVAVKMTLLRWLGRQV